MTLTGTVGQTAKAIVSTILKSYGLTSLGTWAWNQITSGASTQQVVISMYTQPAFKQRFPGITARNKAGLPPISPAQYIAYETQMVQLENQYGLPSGFLSTPDRIGQFIGQDVSANEIQARVANGYAAVAYAPQSTQMAFTSMFGAAGPGALASYFLTEKHSLPLLTQQATAAQFSGMAAQGSVAMSSQDAMQLAQMGVSPSAVQSGVSQIEQQAPLFNPGINTPKGSQVGQSTAIEAQFGLSEQATQQMEAGQADREATFRGGGGPNMDNYGSSLGKAKGS